MVVEQTKTSRAIFFDNDGTLIEEIPFNVDPHKIVLTKGATEALNLLKGKFQFHSVSNQSGVALGIFSEKDLWKVRDRLQELFNNIGAELDGFHFCPHFPQGNITSYAVSCDCRKPGTRMLEEASLEFGIDLKRSWMIGDHLDDVECGKRSGCRTILLDNACESSHQEDKWRVPDFRAKDLEEAASIILAQESN